MSKFTNTKFETSNHVIALTSNEDGQTNLMFATTDDLRGDLINHIMDNYLTFADDEKRLSTREELDNCEDADDIIEYAKWNLEMCIVYSEI